METGASCVICGERGRLHCADCDQVFCVEHLERHFAMGYYYLCPHCTIQRQTIAEPPVAKRRRKPKSQEKP